MLSNTRLGPYFVEATAQALLEPCLDPDRMAMRETVDHRVADAPKCTLCGTYGYEIDAGNEGEADRGTLRIDGRGPPFGTMTLPPSIAAVGQAGVLTPACVPVVDLDLDRRHATAVIVTSAGALILRLRLTATGFDGASTGLFTERSIVGTKTDAPACSMDGEL